MTLLVGLGFVLAAVGPAIGAYASCKAIVPEIERRLAPGEAIACFRRVDAVGDSALFYTGRPGLVVVTEQDLRAYFASPERRYCLVHVDHLHRAQRAADAYYVVHRAGGRLLISNRPDRP